MGEPFELPPKPSALTLDTVAFNEDATTFSQWKTTSQRRGLIELGVVTVRPGFYLDPAQRKGASKQSSAYFVRSYLDLKKRELMSPSWGRAIQNEVRSKGKGVWIRLEAIPVLNPWHLPATWGELKQACQEQGVDLMGHLQALAPKLRDGDHHPMLLGFPIPERYGEEPSQLQWMALRLPVLSHGPWCAKGFRRLEPGYWRRDHTLVLHDARPLEWTNTENWAPEQIATRGQLPSDLASTRVLLIGAGALGSVLAELLVRAGLKELFVIDGDVLKGGNLTRHTLSAADVGAEKARSLADHLNHAFPHASVEAICSTFPPGNRASQDKMLACDVVIDCTASDDVIHAMGGFAWKKDRLFVSLSVGHRARRLFCFAAAGAHFPADDCLARFEPYLEEERTRYADDELRVAPD